ncbi:MAG TPA: AAA family ATPase, partial [Candidatus Sulfotelmatobacter sp.]|nr:AAA family ATPase [Candidatus Sulfotelmatobacter sp.]
DDGRLTDGQGRTVDFKNSIIIMTSNLGSHIIQEEATDEEGMRIRVSELLKTAFRPEFLNRVDEVVIFRRLSVAQIRQIVEIQLRYLQRRLAGRKLELNVTDRVRDYLARQGYDPVYGARPLKRAVQRHLQDPLARRLLEGEFQEGDAVQADLEGSEIIFRRLAPAAAQP